MECVEICLLTAVVHELHQHEVVGRRTIGRVEQHRRRETNTETQRAQLNFEKHHYVVRSKIQVLKGLENPKRRLVLDFNPFNSS